MHCFPCEVLVPVFFYSCNNLEVRVTEENQGTEMLSHLPVVTASKWWLHHSSTTDLIAIMLYSLKKDR